MEDIKTSNESDTDQDQKQQSLESTLAGVAKGGEVSATETGLKADCDAQVAHDSGPPQYGSLSQAPADLVTDFSNSWASPIKMVETQPSTMKRRRTSDAQTPSKNLGVTGVTGIPLLERTRYGA